jgi:hypothetical protein
MSSVEEVFKILSTDEKFIDRVKTSLDNIMKDEKIDQYDAPELVFLIIDSYNQMSNLHLTYEDLPVLIKMLYTFLIEKFNLIHEDKRADFERLLDVSIKLVMLQPKVKKQVSKCLGLFSCFSSNKSEPTKPVVEDKKSEPTKPVEQSVYVELKSEVHVEPEPNEPEAEPNEPEAEPNEPEPESETTKLVQQTEPVQQTEESEQDRINVSVNSI